MSVFRVYAPDELGPDGYPPEWHRADLGPLGDGADAGIKEVVRIEAAHRCIRCLHPYAKGAGEWSACDERCEHDGPFRLITPDGDVLREGPFDPLAKLADIRNAYPTCRIEAAWRILTVHHLDMNKANCRWWNLAALCQRCHLQIQGKVQMHRIWPWSHSEWFRPYVAGYYASVYLGQELERPEVEARLDELLALERVA